MGEMIELQQFKDKIAAKKKQQEEVELNRGILRRINHLLPKEERIPDDE